MFWQMIELKGKMSLKNLADLFKNFSCNNIFSTFATSIDAQMYHKIQQICQISIKKTKIKSKTMKDWNLQWLEVHIVKRLYEICTSSVIRKNVRLSF